MADETCNFSRYGGYADQTALIDIMEPSYLVDDSFDRTMHNNKSLSLQDRVHEHQPSLSPTVNNPRPGLLKKTVLPRSQLYNPTASTSSTVSRPSQLPLTKSMLAPVSNMQTTRLSQSAAAPSRSTFVGTSLATMLTQSAPLSQAHTAASAFRRSMASLPAAKQISALQQQQQNRLEPTAVSTDSTATNTNTAVGEFNVAASLPPRFTAYTPPSMSPPVPTRAAPFLNVSVQHQQAVDRSMEKVDGVVKQEEPELGTALSMSDDTRTSKAEEPTSMQRHVSPSVSYSQSREISAPPPQQDVQMAQTFTFRASMSGSALRSSVGRAPSQDPFQSQSMNRSMLRRSMSRHTEEASKSIVDRVPEDDMHTSRAEETTSMQSHVPSSVSYSQSREASAPQAEQDVHMAPQSFNTYHTNSSHSTASLQSQQERDPPLVESQQAASVHMETVTLTQTSSQGAASEVASQVQVDDDTSSVGELPFLRSLAGHAITQDVSPPHPVPRAANPSPESRADAPFIEHDAQQFHHSTPAPHRAMRSALDMSLYPEAISNERGQSLFQSHMAMHEDVHEGYAEEMPKGYTDELSDKDAKVPQPRRRPSRQPVEVPLNDVMDVDDDSDDQDDTLQHETFNICHSLRNSGSCDVSMLDRPLSQDDMFGRKIRDSNLHLGLDFADDAPGPVQSVTGFALPPGRPHVPVVPLPRSASRAYRPPAKIVDVMQPHDLTRSSASEHAHSYSHSSLGKRKVALTVPHEFHFTNRVRSRTVSHSEAQTVHERPIKRAKVESPTSVPVAYDHSHDRSRRASSSHSHVAHVSYLQQQQQQEQEEEDDEQEPADLTMDALHAHEQLCDQSVKSTSDDKVHQFLNSLVHNDDEALSLADEEDMHGDMAQEEAPARPSHTRRSQSASLSQPMPVANLPPMEQTHKVAIKANVEPRAQGQAQMQTQRRVAGMPLRTKTNMAQTKPLPRKPPTAPVPFSFHSTARAKKPRINPEPQTQFEDRLTSWQRTEATAPTHRPPRPPQLVRKPGLAPATETLMARERVVKAVPREPVVNKRKEREEDTISQPAKKRPLTIKPFRFATSKRAR